MSTTSDNEICCNCRYYTNGWCQCHQKEVGRQGKCQDYEED